MKGLIIASGEIKDYNLLNNMVENHDYIICADGGINHLIKIGKKANLLVGDLDSVSQEALAYIQSQNIAVERYPVMKNETDSNLAIRKMIELGIRDISLMGMLGSRLDHSLANILMLKDMDDLGVSSRIVSKDNIIHYTSSRLKIQRKTGYYLSLIPLNDKGIVVSLKGFLYPLRKEKIKFGSSLGISNQIVDEYGIIEIDQGYALVIESRD